MIALHHVACHFIQSTQDDARSNKHEIYLLTDSFFRVNVNVKAKFTLEQATKAQRWSSGIALLFL